MPDAAASTQSQEVDLLATPALLSAPAGASQPNAAFATPASPKYDERGFFFGGAPPFPGSGGDGGASGAPDGSPPRPASPKYDERSFFFSAGPSKPAAVDAAGDGTPGMPLPLEGGRPVAAFREAQGLTRHTPLPRHLRLSLAAAPATGASPACALGGATAPSPAATGTAAPPAPSPLGRQAAMNAAAPGAASSARFEAAPQGAAPPLGEPGSAAAAAASQAVLSSAPQPMFLTPATGLLAVPTVAGRTPPFSDQRPATGAVLHSSSIGPAGASAATSVANAPAVAVLPAEPAAATASAIAPGDSAATAPSPLTGAVPLQSLISPPQRPEEGSRATPLSQAGEPLPCTFCVVCVSLPGFSIDISYFIAPPGMLNRKTRSRACTCRYDWKLGCDVTVNVTRVSCAPSLCRFQAGHARQGRAADGAER